jgi:large subunit ribosomal protein L30e
MEEIRKLINEGKTILGSKVVIKKLKNGLIEKIFLSKNCKENLKEDIEKFAKVSSVEIINVDMTNEELGTFCKKPFHVSVVGVKKQ